MMHTHQMSGMQTNVLDKQSENQDYSPLTANRRSSADSWNQAELMSFLLFSCICDCRWHQERNHSVFDEIFKVKWKHKFTSVYITMCERTLKAAFLDVQHIWVLSVQTHLGVEQLIASACPSARCCRTSARGGRSERLHVCSQPDVLMGSSVAQMFTWTQISFLIRFWWQISRKEKL